MVLGSGSLALLIISRRLHIWRWKLGTNCNDSIHGDGQLVFRARATTFACLTWFALFLGWEMVNMCRSFFRMQPKSKNYLTQWIRDVWCNQFLFWSIFTGFVTVFPIIYVPVINTVVFKHAPISWKWGIGFVETLLFFLGVEAWKFVKPDYYRRVGETAKHPEDDFERNIFKAYASVTKSIGSGSDIFEKWGIFGYCYCILTFRMRYHCSILCTYSL